LLKANKLGFLVAWVIVASLSIVLGMPLVFVYYTIILALLALMLAAPVGFYLLLMNAAVFGRTYRESVMLAQGEAGGA
jgi:multisubunit Na+/H+ antiporter MnhG subunit